MEVTVALVTVKVALAFTEPSAAVIVVDPGVGASAKPLADIVATFVSDEVQVTSAVMLRLLPSLYDPKALNL